ncbi:hypothetical protein [Amycolatopsis orientalis]|uniref:hypothetical protein n=1 Tax=Amycolatopsis orientalis TaxID=31958 RepID=UPI00126851B3|nr:hypothetical protein [Amycolatopsis orientalis]
MSTTTYSAFAPAAHRHLDDAEYLHEAKRWANADHLTGFAAECGLKAILISYLGGKLTTGGKPTHDNIPSGSRSYGHIDRLWDQLGATVTGRNGAQFSALIAAPNPFSSWKVDERYSDGTHIDETRVTAHLTHARRILSLHEQARINGAII